MSKPKHKNKFVYKKGDLKIIKKKEVKEGVLSFTKFLSRRMQESISHPPAGFKRVMRFWKLLKGPVERCSRL
jgi:hypothetical protein